jgi:CheY-like chemotaxis protein/c-di-GMP-binding flagellar brake protein YcgR
MTDEKSVVFSDMLSVGLEATFDSDLSGEQRWRQRCIVRGWDLGQYILIELTGKNDRARVLPQHETCVVRFLHEGTACAFQAEILDCAIKKKRRQFHLSWPKDMQHLTVRRHERVKVNVPAVLECDGGEKRSCSVRDVSKDGCGLLMDEELSAGTIVKISFTLPDGCAIDGADLIVRSCTSTKDGEVLGCQFFASDHSTREDVEFYVSSILARGQHSGEEVGRVQIIDPQPDNLEALQAQLEKHGVVVSVQSNVVDGLFRLRLAPPHALLLSEDQGAINGVELCNVVRSGRGFGDLPIHIHGQAGKSLKDVALGAGATGYFDDLANPEDIANALASHAPSAKAGEPNSESPAADD